MNSKPSATVQKTRLTPHSLTVLSERYLIKDEDGKIIENPDEMFWRVSRAIASVEVRRRKVWAEKFFELMASCRFIPNSPTLMNAGKARGQLSACYVLPIEDSLDSIFTTLKNAAKIHQSGGGTGFSFSELRPKGSLVRSSAGVASGPVSFMRIFDVATDTIKQGGTRRGANMAILRVDHPDILEFINCKLDRKSITNFNISIGMTDLFMQSVKMGSSHEVKLFNRICQSAWECGDPGMVFQDRINLFNPTPAMGPMVSTNPCGEQPLLPYESCNLGSLNLGLYYQERKFNWDQFREDIWLATRFLDNVIDANCFPISECEKLTRKNRKIGLGVMGFADLLIRMNISYRHPDAEAMGEKVMSFLDREAKAASMDLAKSRGSFPNWKNSMWHKLGYPQMRNATVSTVAPTGTISMIAGASSGIEPIFSAIFYRNILDGKRLKEVHPVIDELIREKGLTTENLTDDMIQDQLGEVWCPASQVPVDVHVRIQAAFQRHCDSAVSKTINLPETATVEDVAHAYLLAFELGCKGITVYRDKSRAIQVLEHAIPPSNLTQGDGEANGASCPSC